MQWHPERDVRVKRHSLDYTVPRDRQLDSLEINRPGETTVVTDTLYVVRCPYCKEVFEGSTQVDAGRDFKEHHDARHPSTPKQHELPQWFRELMSSREADIAKLQYDHENHDY